MEIHIAEIDTEKYLNWLLNNEATTKEIEIAKLEQLLIRDLERIDSNEQLTDSEKQLYKSDERKRTDRLIKGFDECEYWKAPTEKEKQMILHSIDYEIEWRTNHIIHTIETVPLDRKTLLSKELNEILTKELPKCKEIHSHVINGWLTQDYYKLAHYIALVRFAQYLYNEIEKESNIVNTPKNAHQLTHPQKIMLLDKLGFFKLEIFTQLTNGQRDKIVSLLIEEDETNTRKYTNGLTSQRKTDNYNPYKNSINEIIINKLLNDD